MSDGNWESELMAEVFTDAAPTEDAPVEDASPPDAEPAVAAQEAEPVADAVPAPVTTEPAPVVEAAGPIEVPEAPKTNWDSEENPHFAEAMQLRQLREQLGRQQELLAQQQMRAEIEELSDGDAERLQKIVGLLTRTTDPLQQQVGSLNQRAHMAEKQAVALLVAAQHHLSPQQFAELREEVGTLLQVEGVEVMESVAKSRKGLSAETQRQIAAKDARIKELELQIAARMANAQADSTNAHTVDAGGGGTALSRYDRAAQATTEDDFFDALWGAA